MSICKFCNKDMKYSDSCIPIPIIHNGIKYLPIKFEENGKEHREFNEEGRCNDCGVKLGGYHHSGCDNEVCPICEGQVAFCGCIDNIAD